MFNLFIEGGIIGMGLITIELIALLLAAWKAPNWVKEIGLIALVTGILWMLTGLMQAAGVIQLAGDVSPVLMWGAIRVACISVVYSILVYVVSLIIRIVQKPRLL